MIEKKQETGMKKAIQVIKHIVLTYLLLILVISLLTTNYRESGGHIFGWLARVIMKSFIWSLWSLNAIIIFNEITTWYKADRLCGGGLLAKMHKTLIVRRRCTYAKTKQTGPTKIELIVAPLSLIASYFVLTDLLLVVSAYCWVGIVTNILTFIRPPIVLFLAKSETRTLILQQAISFAIGAAEVVSLLDLDRYSGYNWAQAESQNVVRARAGEDWRSIVLEFSEIVRIIVLDFRLITSNVELEASLLARPELAGRTFIIQDKDSLSEGFENFNCDELILAGAKIVTTEELQSALRNACGLPT